MFSPVHTLLLASLHVWDEKASPIPPWSRPRIKPCFVACTASGEFSQIFSAQEIAVSTALPRGTTSFTLRMVRDSKRMMLEDAYSQLKAVTSLDSGYVPSEQEHLRGKLMT